MTLPGCSRGSSSTTGTGTAGMSAIVTTGGYDAELTVRIAA